MPNSYMRFAPALAAAAFTLAVSAPGSAQVTPLPHDQGAVGLGLALRHLPVDGSMLYVTAHPDDENNGVFVALNRGRGIKTNLYTLTRGDGGQNEIGPELFQAIGVLRTEELNAVHRYDNATQYFSRAFEFGYSFSVEETFEKWGKDEILGDVVRVIRMARPDIILTMPREAPGGGQHHQASARLAAEAFRAAADPKRYPEQIAAGLRPWQARKIYEAASGSPGAGLGGPETGAKVTTPVSTADFDPLLGMSWNQFGALARCNHMCQGMGQLEARPGAGAARFSVVDSEPAVTGAEKDLFDGIDTSLGRIAAFAKGQESKVATLAQSLTAIEADARAAGAAFDVRAPHKTLPALAAGLAKLRALRDAVKASTLTADARDEILYRLDRKVGDFERALVLAQGLVVHVTVNDGNVIRGQSFEVTAAVFNTGAEPVTIDDVRVNVPGGWTATLKAGAPKSLAYNQSATLTYTVTVGPQARYSQPYWVFNPDVDRYTLAIPEHFGLPWSPPDVTADIRYTTAGVTATLNSPAYFRYEGPWVGGEKQKVVNIVPVLSVKMTPDVAIVPVAAAGTKREFRVTVLNNAAGGGTARVRLEVPAGWTVEPKDTTLTFSLEEEEMTARFFVTPPASLKEGEAEIKAVASRDGIDYREGYRVIAYDHIQARHLYDVAASHVKVIDVAVAPNLQIGYVMGSGDEVPAAIQQLGASVTLLSADDIAFGNLAKFSTIVLGIRAHEKRPDLRAYNQRLLDFVRAGGHLVVQYNKVDFNQLGSRLDFNAPPPATSPFAPYAGIVSRDRVTVEEAPITVLAADRVELNKPNRIGDRDFANWVQERGLYFFEARDSHYVDLLASADPWPKNPGTKKGLLTVAPLGNGTWTYVGLGLWRQLPAGTPGAYRLLANLVSRPRNDAAAPSVQP